MRNLKLIAQFFIVIYILFVLINTSELFWNGFRFFGSHKMDFMSSFMKIEGEVHFWLNILDSLLQLIFLFFLNHFVKKHKLGKGYHFLVILLSFIPLVYCILFFMVWRKLNREIIWYSGNDSTSSDRKIVFIWVILLGLFGVIIVASAIVYYSESPELIVLIRRLEGFGPFLNSAFLLLTSFAFLSYFIEFNRLISGEALKEGKVGENQLLDD